MTIIAYRKTPTAERGVYKYHSVTGAVVLISCENVNLEMIRLLHRMDDNEVNNNIKNSRPTLTAEQKKAIVEWEEQHPGEEVPKNWNLSLDGLLHTDNADHSSYMKELADMQTGDGCDPLRELLHEWIAEMSPDTQKLFHMLYIEERTQSEVALEFGISQRAVSKRKQKLENALHEKYQKR